MWLKVPCERSSCFKYPRPTSSSSDSLESPMKSTDPSPVAPQLWQTEVSRNAWANLTACLECQILIIDQSEHVWCDAIQLGRQADWLTCLPAVGWDSCFCQSNTLVEWRQYYETPFHKTTVQKTYLMHGTSDKLPSLGTRLCVQLFNFRFHSNLLFTYIFTVLYCVQN